MLATMQEMLRSHDLCVLATAAENRPHCSLMAYVCDDAARYVYMVTYRHSLKFRNLQDNPAVSLLVDTRGGGGAEIKALTAAGVYEPLQDPAAIEAARSRLLAAHPRLEVFLKSDGAEIIAVRLSSFLLLDGLTEAAFEQL